MFGMADWITPGADDLPDVSVRGEKFSSNVEGIGASYHYTTQDLRAAAFAGMPLTNKLASAAGMSIERKMDQAAALGQTELGMFGFAKHPNVPVDTAADNGSGSTLWSAKTADQILADLLTLTNTMWEATLELYAPDTLILPTSLYSLIARKLTGVDVKQTVLNVFKATDVHIQNVYSWNRLEGAADDGGARIVAYKRSTDVLEAAVPMEMIQHEPEKRNLKFWVPMEARFGGVIVYKPLAMRYLDGAGV
jgi:hypothetical protein